MNISINLGAYRVNLSLDSLKGIHPILVHARQIKDCLVLGKAVDKDSKALKVDIIMFTIDLY
jgi:hypothetical protein